MHRHVIDSQRRGACVIREVKDTVGHDEMLDEHHRQRLRLFRRLGCRCWFTGDEIGKVELAIAPANDVARRVCEPDFTECPGPAEKGRELEIDVELVESSEWFTVGLR